MYRISRFINVCILLIIFILPSEMYSDNFVQGKLWGRFGNHLFIIAAATSLALDNGSEAIFPEYCYTQDQNPHLLNNVFVSGLNTRSGKESISYVYREPRFSYNPIPFRPNMMIEGYFQSEKYFKNHKNEIIQMFQPKEEIVQYLRSKYSDIIENPKIVSVHLRDYYGEQSCHVNFYQNNGRDYFEKAAAYFPEDTQFIVFSDRMGWAKNQLAGTRRKVRFIEGENFIHDFYLMSLCRHNIITNSSFSWWAAYLNQNPEKIVIAPVRWFIPSYISDTQDLIPESWILVN